MMKFEKYDEYKLYNLGVYYEDICEYDLAEKYLKMAANKNYSYAQYYLGLFYYNNNVKRNIYLAEKYLKISADKDNITAQYHLGLLYYSDIKDYNLAEKYLKLAADEGCNSAQNVLGNLYKTMENYELAEKYYKIAISNNNITALNNLGLLLYDKNNYKLSRKYFLLANNDLFLKSFNKLNKKYEEIQQLEKTYTCIICYNNKCEMKCKKCGNNNFCYNCIYEWTIINNKTCPLCRN